MSWGQDKMMGGARKNETPAETAAREKRDKVYGNGINQSGVQTGRFSSGSENRSNPPRSEK